MTDKELLELAAKAAGIELNWGIDLFGFYTNDGETVQWNPLTDDGDALRLAVKLGINISTPDDGDMLASATHWNLPMFFAEKADADPYAATRRAIVHAAASLATSNEFGRNRND